MNKTIYGVYESNAEVIQAIDALKAKGFEGDDITVVADKEETLDFANHQRETDVHTMTNVPNDESFMDKVARFFMPDDTADLSTRLANAGLSNSDAAEHVFDVENGKVLVLVDESEGHLGMTKDKFMTGTTDTAGTRPDTNSITPLYNGTEKNDALNKEDIYGVNGQGRKLPEDERTLQLREEQLNIDKERVQTGKVLINKEVNEQHKTINVPVEHEEVTIEHRSVSGRESKRETGSMKDGETFRIPVVEEQLEVSKKPVVTDEIVIKKHAVQETEQGQDTLKTEDIQLDSTDESIVNEKKETGSRSDRF
ncbi:Stress response protein YsnF [Peribacillus sp. Bi96]|uniref:YsnF/AvaK domain-containing protein n=1 Tax=Peribacillus sp. Bi96 TaxID=2884273 RepID=UPI001D7783C6|nr:YsnF/AvaK domain-containing protein [Peribacillus sp. Bi96]CAH0129173.1 Stress response protein YsnF [Peribacillus sp. Bi96]